MGKQEAWGKHTFRESWAGEALWERHESPGGVLPAKRSGWATGPDMAAGEVMPPQSATWRDHPSTCLPAAPSTQLHGSGQQHQETGVLGPALKEAVDGVPNPLPAASGMAERRWGAGQLALWIWASWILCALRYQNAEALSETRDMWVRDKSVCRRPG